MDINHLYFKHQISTMRVSSAKDSRVQSYHQDKADGLARRIARMQQDNGASAAASWIPSTDSTGAEMVGTTIVPSAKV